MTPAYPATSNQPAPAAVKKVNPVWIIALLLAYTAAAQVAVGTGIDRLVAENAEYNQFSSQEVLVTFLRVGVIVWSALASFLQALVLRLIYKGIVRGQAPTLRSSWFWVLLGQIPFMLTVLGLFLAADAFTAPDALGVLGQAWLRILFGAVGAAIYAVLARKTLGAPVGRLAVLFAIVTIVNSVLLVAGGPA